MKTIEKHTIDIVAQNMTFGIGASDKNTVFLYIHDDQQNSVTIELDPVRFDLLKERLERQVEINENL